MACLEIGKQSPVPPVPLRPHFSEILEPGKRFDLVGAFFEITELFAGITGKVDDWGLPFQQAGIDRPGDQASEINGCTGKGCRIVVAECDDRERIPQSGDDRRLFAGLVREDDKILGGDILPVVISHCSGERFANPVEKCGFHGFPLTGSSCSSVFSH
jgi:hypothetical protein